MVGAQRIRLGTLLAAAASPTCPWCRGHAEIKTLQAIFNNMAIFTWVIDATIRGRLHAVAWNRWPEKVTWYLLWTYWLDTRTTHTAVSTTRTRLYMVGLHAKFTPGPEDFVCHVVYCVRVWPEMQSGSPGKMIGHDSKAEKIVDKVVSDKGDAELVHLDKVSAKSI